MRVARPHGCVTIRVFATLTRSPMSLSVLPFRPLYVTLRSGRQDLFRAAWPWMVLSAASGCAREAEPARAAPVVVAASASVPEFNQRRAKPDDASGGLGRSPKLESDSAFRNAAECEAGCSEQEVCVAINIVPRVGGGRLEVLSSGEPVIVDKAGRRRELSTSYACKPLAEGCTAPMTGSCAAQLCPSASTVMPTYSASGPTWRRIQCFLPHEAYLQGG